MRSERFMFYAMPWFFAIWGIAASALALALKNVLDKYFFGTGWFGATTLRRKSVPLLSISLVAGIAVFALLTVPAVETFARMTLGKPGNPPEYWDRYKTYWRQSADFLRQETTEIDVVVASQPLQAIYYLGDVNYTLNATTLADIAAPGVHSKMDLRTGRLVFDDTETLRKIVACNSSGAIILHGPAWRNPTRVGNEVSDYIESRLESVPVPGKSDLLLFRWSAATVRDERCAQ
jgi:hypothetical protein